MKTLKTLAAIAALTVSSMAFAAAGDTNTTTKTFTQAVSVLQTTDGIVFSGAVERIQVPKITYEITRTDNGNGTHETRVVLTTNTIDLTQRKTLDKDGVLVVSGTLGFTISSSIAIEYNLPTKDSVGIKWTAVNAPKSSATKRVLAAVIAVSENEAGETVKLMSDGSVLTFHDSEYNWN